MLSNRIRNVEILKLIFQIAALVSIGALASAIILFFAAYTGQFIRDADVEWVWRLFKTSIVATGVCGVLALGFYVFNLWVAKALERYSETHCGECEYDLTSLIGEKREQRKEDRKGGTSLHGSLYFDIYCPNCKCQRTMRE